MCVCVCLLRERGVGERVEGETLVLAETSALAFKSTLTTSACPFSAAMCKGRASFCMWVGRAGKRISGRSNGGGEKGTERVG